MNTGEISHLQAEISRVGAACDGYTADASPELWLVWEVEPQVGIGLARGGVLTRYGGL